MTKNLCPICQQENCPLSGARNHANLIGMFQAYIQTSMDDIAKKQELLRQAERRKELEEKHLEFLMAVSELKRRIESQYP